MKKPRLPLPLITAIAAGWILSGCHKLASYEESYAVTGKTTFVCEAASFYRIDDKLAAKMETLYEDERQGKIEAGTFYDAVRMADFPLQARLNKPDLSEGRIALRLPPGLYVMYLAFELMDERLVWVNGSVDLGDIEPTEDLRCPPYGKHPRL